MWSILQENIAEDFVITAGITTYIRDFVAISFSEVGITIRYERESVDEIGIIEDLDQDKFDAEINHNQQSSDKETRKSTILPSKVGQIIIRIDSQYYRPTEVDILIGNSTKSINKLGWKPKYTLKPLI